MIDEFDLGDGSWDAANGKGKQAAPTAKDAFGDEDPFASFPQNGAPMTPAVTDDKKPSPPLPRAPSHQASSGSAPPLPAFPASGSGPTSSPGLTPVSALLSASALTAANRRVSQSYGPLPPLPTLEPQQPNADDMNKFLGPSAASAAAPNAAPAATAATAAPSAATSSSRPPSRPSSPAVSVSVSALPPAAVPSITTTNHSGTAHPAAHPTAPRADLSPSTPEERSADVHATAAAATASADDTVESLRKKLADKAHEADKLRRENESLNGRLDQAAATINKANADKVNALNTLKKQFAEASAKNKNHFVQLHTKFKEVIASNAALISQNQQYAKLLEQTKTQTHQAELGAELLANSAKAEAEGKRLKEETNALQAKLESAQRELEAAKQEVQHLTKQKDLDSRVTVSIQSMQDPPVNGKDLKVVLHQHQQSVNGDVIIQWGRSFAGSQFVPIHGKHANHVAYVPTVDDIGAVLQAECTFASGAIITAEIGPVECNRTMVTQISEHLKKAEVSFPVENWQAPKSTGSKPGAAPHAADDEPKSILLNKEKIKLRIGKRTTVKAPYSNLVHATPDTDIPTKFGLKVDEKVDVSFEYQVKNPLERDIIVLTVRLFKFFFMQKAVGRERPDDQYLALLYSIRQINEQAHRRSGVDVHKGGSSLARSNTARVGGQKKSIDDGQPSLSAPRVQKRSGSVAEIDFLSGYEMSHATATPLSVNVSSSPASSLNSLRSLGGPQQPITDSPSSHAHAVKVASGSINELRKSDSHSQSHASLSAHTLGTPVHAAGGSAASPASITHAGSHSQLDASTPHEREHSKNSRNENHAREPSKNSKDSKDKDDKAKKSGGGWFNRKKNSKQDEAGGGGGGDDPKVDADGFIITENRGFSNYDEPAAAAADDDFSDDEEEKEKRKQRHAARAAAGGAAAGGPGGAVPDADDDAPAEPKFKIVIRDAPITPGTPTALAAPLALTGPVVRKPKTDTIKEGKERKSKKSSHSKHGKKKDGEPSTPVHGADGSPAGSGSPSTPSSSISQPSAVAAASATAADTAFGAFPPLSAESPPSATRITNEFFPHSSSSSSSSSSASSSTSSSDSSPPSAHTDKDAPSGTQPFQADFDEPADKEKKQPSSSSSSSHDHDHDHDYLPVSSSHSAAATDAPAATPALPQLAADEVEAIVSETVHARLSNGVVGQLAVTGEVTLQVGAPLASDSVAHFTLQNTGALSNLAPNRAALSIVSKGTYAAKMLKGSQSLKILAYKVVIAEGDFNSKCPMIVNCAWKCEAASTVLDVDYSAPSALAKPLLQVKVVVPAFIPEGVVKSCTFANPKCMWNPKSQKMMWSLPSVASGSSGKLHAEFANTALTKPAPMTISFVSDQSSALSGLQMVAAESAAADGVSSLKMARTVYQVKSGQFTVSS